MSDDANDSDVEDQKHRKMSQNSTSSDDVNKVSDKKNFMFCENCGRRGHLEKDCWDKKENASRRPPYYKPRKSNVSTNVMPEQINTMIQTALKSYKKSKTHRVNNSEDSDSDVNDSNFMQASDTFKSVTCE